MNNINPEVLRIIAAIPVLAAEPAFQHTTRIYLENDITRFSPLFVPLMALGAVSRSGCCGASIHDRFWSSASVDC